MSTRQIKIIPLAKKKLSQRGIDEFMVLETVNNPDQVVKGHGGRSVAQKQYQLNKSDYLLRAVYEENHSEIVVITGYLTSQISRYWEVDQ